MIWILPPRFQVCRLSHSLFRKFVNDASMKVRNFPFCRSTFLSVFLFEQMRKESLGQILGIVLIMAASPDECIDRVPVNATKPFQSNGGFGEVALSGTKHHAPMGGGESGDFPSAKVGGFRNKTKCLLSRPLIQVSAAALK